jgi:hypothetical protein
MRHICATALLFLCLGLISSAQQERTITSTTCTASDTTGCAEFTVNGAGTMGVQIGGSFTGILKFEQTINLRDWKAWSVFPSDSATAVTQTTTEGIWTGTVAGITKIRVRADTLTDGSATVYAVSAQAKAGGTRGVAPPVGIVVVDSVADAANAANTSPLTFQHTNTAGTLLLCGINITQVSPNNTPIINSVTYAGVPMTLWASYATGIPVLDGDGSLLAYYYQQNPALGENDVQVAFDFTGDPDNANKNTMAGCMGFTGADPVTPFGPPVKQKETTLGNTTQMTITVPDTTRGNIVISMLNTGTGGIDVDPPTLTNWLLNNSTHTAGDNGVMTYKVTEGGDWPTTIHYTMDVYSAMAIEVFAEGTAHGH